jgi:hypothetical protein
MPITYKDAYIKLQYRLNKSGTEDYSTIDYDPASEAINKAFNDLYRRVYHGVNITKEGAEESRLRIDDLQPLLVPLRPLSVTTTNVFSESVKLPKDYRYYNRVDFYHKDDNCKDKLLITPDLREEANVGVLLNTDGTKPSLKFEQCFLTLLSNKIRVYHNREFDFEEILLTYYKSPKIYDSKKQNELFELKDDFIEIVIDEAAKIISGDSDNSNQYQRNSSSVEQNT